MNREVTIEEFLPATIIPKQGRERELKLTRESSFLVLKAAGAKKQIKLPKKVTLQDDDLIAIGLYFAEGYRKVNYEAKYRHDGSITFVGSHPEMINPFCGLLAKFLIARNDLKWKIGININSQRDPQAIIKFWVAKIGLPEKNMRKAGIYRTGHLGKKMSDREENGCVHIYYPSVIFRSFFIAFINKLFDDFLNAGSKQELALIVKGYFAGDGCVHYCKEKSRKMVDFACNNPELLEKLRRSLVLIGLHNIRETFPERTKTHNKSLRIYNVHDFRILHDYQIPSLIPYKEKVFLDLLSRYH